MCKGHIVIVIYTSQTCEVCRQLEVELKGVQYDKRDIDIWKDIWEWIKKDNNINKVPYIRISNNGILYSSLLVGRDFKSPKDGVKALKNVICKIEKKMI